MIICNFICLYIYHTHRHIHLRCLLVNQHLTPSRPGGMVSGRHGSGAAGRSSLFPLPCEWRPNLSLRSEKKVALYPLVN